MRTLLLATLISVCSAATADNPPGVSRKLMSFVLTTCDYLQAKANDHPSPPERAVARHLGRILKAVRSDDPSAFIFHLAVPQLPGWRVVYLDYDATVTVPKNVVVTVADLERLNLGAVESVSVDQHLGGASGPRNETNWQFQARADRPGCHIILRTDGSSAQPSPQRVLELEFND